MSRRTYTGDMSVGPAASPDTVRGGGPRLVDRAYVAIRDDLIALRIEPGPPWTRGS